MQTRAPETKTQGTLYSEILNFQKYFKIPNNPFHMERTIREASEVLEEKLRQATVPPNANSKQNPLLKKPQTESFYPNFPPIQNVPFGMAKPIPGLEWSLPFRIDSVYKLPKEKQVTIASCQEAIPFDL